MAPRRQHATSTPPTDRARRTDRTRNRRRGVRDARGTAARRAPGASRPSARTSPHRRRRRARPGCRAPGRSRTSRSGRGRRHRGRRGRSRRWRTARPSTARGDQQLVLRHQQLNFRGSEAGARRHRDASLSSASGSRAELPAEEREAETAGRDGQRFALRTAPDAATMLVGQDDLVVVEPGPVPCLGPAQVRDHGDVALVRVSSANLPPGPSATRGYRSARCSWGRAGPPRRRCSPSGRRCRAGSRTGRP